MTHVQNYSQYNSGNGSDIHLNVFNLTHTHSEAVDDVRHKDLYLWLQYITGLFCYPVVCCIGLAGNIISIIVFSQSKMRSSTNCYLIALAIGDLIKLLNDSFYFVVILLMNVDPPSGVASYGYLYPYAHYLFSMSVCVTAWLTISVATERYIMVS